MKKVLVCALAVALLAGPAFAQGKVATLADKLETWGKTGATPAVFKDTRENYAGYWWWPTEAKSNNNDAELWGNRGIVYAMYTEPKPPAPPAPAPPPPAPAPKVERQAVLYNHVLFDFDKAVLKPEGKAETDKVIADLKKYGKDTMLIEGHTCNIGAPDYNMGLGQRRADAVKKYMVEQGIDAGRLTTKSLGLTDPAKPNDSPANRKLNRRAVFKTAVVNE